MAKTHERAGLDALPGRVIAAALVAVAMATLLAPSARATSHGHPAVHIYCGDGAVGVTPPRLLTDQGNRWTGPGIVYWQPQLYYYNFSTREWTLWQNGAWWWDDVKSEHGSMETPDGGTKGWAGPDWKLYGGTETRAAYGWSNLASGYYWAMKSWLYDRGLWRSAWAQNVDNSGVYWCRF